MVNATCSALHCSSSSRTHRHLKFHHFPNDEKSMLGNYCELRRVYHSRNMTLWVETEMDPASFWRTIWLNACKRTDVIDKEWQFFKHKYVCSLHFQKCVYTKKGRLKKFAVPSLHLSEKPHDSSIHTEKSTQYVRPYQNIEQCQNNLSLLNVVQTLETSSTTTYAQVDVKEESKSFKPNIEMKTENDDDIHEYSDLETSEEEVEIKPDIGETEILPIARSTQSLLSVQTHTMTEELVSFEPDVEIKTEKNYDVDEKSDLETSEEEIEIKPDIGETEILPVTHSAQSFLSVLTHTTPEDLVLFEPDVEIKTEINYDVNEKSDLETYQEDVEIKPDIGETEILPVTHSAQSLLSVLTHTTTEDLVLFEPDVEIKTEINYDVNEKSDLETYEEDVEIKPDIGETEILPILQSRQSLLSVLTHTKVEELVSFEPDVEIKTENDNDIDENSDLKPYEEDMEIKLDIGETEILPAVQSTLSLQSVVSEIITDDEILCSQSKKPFQEIDQGKAETIVKRIESSVNTNSIDTTSMIPILGKKNDKLIQTDRVIVFNLNPDGSVSVNPEACVCEKKNLADMTRAQLYRCCSKFY